MNLKLKDDVGVVYMVRLVLKQTVMESKVQEDKVEKGLVY